MFIKYVTKLATRKQIQELKSKYQTITNTNTNECINEKKIHMKREKDRANGKILKGHRAVFNICSEKYILSLFETTGGSSTVVFQIEAFVSASCRKWSKSKHTINNQHFKIHPCLQDQPRKRLKYWPTCFPASNPNAVSAQDPDNCDLYFWQHNALIL